MRLLAVLTLLLLLPARANEPMAFAPFMRPAAAAGGGCTFGTLDGTSAGGISGAYSQLVTPTCTGNLTQIEVDVTSAGAWDVRLAVYLDDGDEIRNVGDTLVESATLSGSGAGTEVVSFAGTSQLNSANKYWYVIASNTGSSYSFQFATVVGGAFSSGHTWSTAPANLTNDGAITWTAQSRIFDGRFTLQ